MRRVVDRIEQYRPYGSGKGHEAAHQREEQAEVRAEQKGFEAAQAAIEMALLQEWTHSNFGEN